jgi:OmpA-OmpF porin, OOP family
MTQRKEGTMNKKWIVSTLGAAAIAVSAGAYAQQPATTGFYIGAEVGNTDVEHADSDVGFKFLGGYQFNRYIAAELGYGLLYDKSDVEVKTLEAVAVGMFPIANQFSIIGKLGFANVDVKVPAGSDDKTELTWGVGVQYDFNRNLGVRALWQRYETDDAVDFLAVGVTWKF